MSILSRPSLFIGSSVEGLPVAQALQSNLDRLLEVTIWSQGVFGLAGGTLEDLATKLQQVDFGALVVTADDVVISRDIEQPAPRDNVLLELGMCIGTLGKDRSFLVYDRTSNIKIPSDLAGITLAGFQQHSDGNLQSALGAVSTAIQKKSSEIGIRTKIGQVGLVDHHTHFRIIADLLGVIADNFIIQLLEPGRFLVRERGFGLSHGKHWYSIYAPGKHRGAGRFSVDSMCRNLEEADIIAQKLNFQVVLTERGKKFAQWLIDNGYRAEAFDSNLGGWGESGYPADLMETYKEGAQSYD